MSALPRVVLAALLLAAPVVVHAEGTEGTGQPPAASKTATRDFSGTWVLDVERSWIGAADKEPLPAETLHVRQTATTLVVEADPARSLRASSIPLHEPVRSSGGGQTRDVQSRWMDDRLVVTTAWSRARATGLATVVWALSADGSELILDGTGLDQDHSRPNVTVTTELTFKRVYRRQR